MIIANEMTRIKVPEDNFHYDYYSVIDLRTSVRNTKLSFGRTSTAIRNTVRGQCARIVRGAPIRIACDRTACNARFFNELPICLQHVERMRRTFG